MHIAENVIVAGADPPSASSAAPCSLPFSRRCWVAVVWKSIDEALELTNKQIVDELGGLPAVKIHCSVLADHAIKSAIYDYAQKNGKTYKGLEGFDPDADDDDHHDVE